MLAAEAAKLGLPAQALTDHGRVSGIVEFHKACGKHGITPIHGIEAYVWAEDLQRPAHLILLAGDQGGLHNIYRLSSISETNHQGRPPRPCITWADLEKYNEGVVVGSGCVGSEVGRLVTSGSMKEAVARARWYRDVFGERYYLEVQNQNDGQPDDFHLRFMDGVIKIGEQLDIPVVATNDSHYTCIGDKAAHRMILVMDGKGGMADAYRGDLSICTSDTLARKMRVGTDVDPAPYIQNSMGVWSMLQDMGVESINPCRTSIAMPVYEYRGKKKSAKDMDPIKRIRDICLTNLSLLKQFGSLNRKTVDSSRWTTMEDGLYRTYVDRIEHELRIIDKTGFANYFLIVADYVRYVKVELNDLVGSGRGSAAGSLVAFLLRITEVDPIKYGLLFERMLNEDRPPNKPPDIDLDFTPAIRDKVVKYLQDRYGDDKVVRIGSFMNQGLKDSIRRVGGHIGMGRPQVSAITNRIPATDDIDILTQKDAAGNYAYSQLADTFEEDTELWENTALISHQSVKREARHPAGVIVSSVPIQEWCPQRISVDANGNNISVSQFDMYSLEDVGLIKFDLLVLGTMRVLTDCVEYVRKGIRDREYGKAVEAGIKAGGSVKAVERKSLRQANREANNFSLYSIDTDDPQVYELFNTANTRGVFQLSSNPSIREMFARLKPSCIEDLAVGCALYRPGPLDSSGYWDGEEDPAERKLKGMKGSPRSAVEEYIRRRQGLSPAHSIHPKVDAVLSETYGIMIYQEQVLKIAVECAGYTILEADRLREAVGKKKQEMIRAEEPTFMAGATNILGDASLAEMLWKLIQAFGEYGFNQAHSVSYAMLSYQTAWFKRYYPAAFYAAMIDQELDKRHQDRMVEYVHDAKNNGITVDPPSILNATRKCHISEDGRALRLGLESVKGISETGSGYLSSHLANPDNRHITNFLRGLDTKKVGTTLLQNMIEIGMFDEMLAIPRETAIEDKLFERGRVVAALQYLKEWVKKCETSVYIPSDGGFYEDVVSILEEKVAYYEARDLTKEGNRKNRETWATRLERLRSYHLSLVHMLSRENSLLGMFISGDPLSDYQDTIQSSHSVRSLSSLVPDDDGKTEQFAFVISAIKRRTSKKTSNPFWEVRLVDATDSVEAMIWHSSKISEDDIQLGNIAVSYARIEWKEGSSYVLILEDIRIIGNLEDQDQVRYRVELDCSMLTVEEMLKIRGEVLKAPSGDNGFYMSCGDTISHIRSFRFTPTLFKYMDSKSAVSITADNVDAPEEIAA